MAARKCVVGPETERMLKLGHPWVIADRYTADWPDIEPGRFVELVNGDGECLGTALASPGERIVARLLDRRRVTPGGQWFHERLQAAVALRRIFIDQEETTAYRLVNGEGDGLPGLTVDRYGDYLMVQCFSPAWSPHLQTVCKQLEQLLMVRGIYEKARPQDTRKLQADSSSKRYSRLVSGDAAGQCFEVLENGLAFLVDLDEGLDTGLFFDQRDNRRRLMRMASGRSMLNLFAYTGAFSVAAAAGGASRVTSVDVSQAYLDRARDNFSINRLNPKRHVFIEDDCFAALKQFSRRNERFDIILFDPPSFSTTRKSTFSTRGGTAELVAATLPLLAQNGLLIASSNHQKTDFADYLKEMRKGALRAGGNLKVVGLHAQPADFPYPVTFPEGRYLKYLVTTNSGM